MGVRWWARPWLRFWASIVAINCWNRHVGSFRKTKVRKGCCHLWRFQQLKSLSIVWFWGMGVTELHFFFWPEVGCIFRTKYLRAWVDNGSFHWISLPKLCIEFVAFRFFETRWIRLCLWVIFGHLWALMDVIWPVHQITSNNLHLIIHHMLKRVSWRSICFAHWQFSNWVIFLGSEF